MNAFTLTIHVESPRDAADTVEQFQKFFDYYHPGLKAKVERKVEVVKPEKPEEDLM